jgi:hypothetical protein
LGRTRVRSARASKSEQAIGTTANKTRNRLR